MRVRKTNPLWSSKFEEEKTGKSKGSSSSKVGREIYEGTKNAGRSAIKKGARPTYADAPEVKLKDGSKAGVFQSESYDFSTRHPVHIHEVRDSELRDEYKAFRAANAKGTSKKTKKR